MKQKAETWQTYRETTQTEEKNPKLRTFSDPGCPKWGMEYAVFNFMGKCINFI
jgi:hypothetical protein